MYEVLKTTILEDTLNITFYKKIIFDYDTEERYFCLTVKNNDGTDETVLLDFIYDSDEFEDKAQTTIRKYLLNEIADDVDCVACDLGIEDLKIDVNEFDYEIKINDKCFTLEDDLYRQLETNIIDYVKTLITK